MSKLCVSCEKTVNDLTDELFSGDNDTIPRWFKEIGNYSLLPPPLNRNPKYNLFNKTNIKSSYPDNYDTTINSDITGLLPEIKNTWVFYWAARQRNYNNTSYPEPANAYQNFSNCGLAKIDKEGKIVFKLRNPTPYQYEKIKYPPHLHFVYLDKSGLWDENCNTLIVTPNLNLNQFKNILENGKYLVICAIPEKLNLPLIPKTKRLGFESNIDRINTKISKLVGGKLLKKHESLRNLPIVVYCKNPECEASSNLIQKLRKLKYINLLTFKGGIEKYFDKTF